MILRSITQIKNLKGKRVLVRVDFNVPLKNGKVKDDYKIVKSLPTIKYLIGKKAKIILVSHLGRPTKYDPSLSLLPIAKCLEKMLDVKLKFIKIKKTEDLKLAEIAVSKLKNGEIAILDNVRFLFGEESNDKVLAKTLADLADVFVLDGFAVAHRDAASVTGVAKYLPAVAGLLIEEEVKVLDKAVSHPGRPLVVILGGAKIETKIPIIKNLLPKADYILLGGGIASTYWWAKGLKMGSSLFDPKYKKEALKYFTNKKVILPVDVVVGASDGKKAQIMSIDSRFKIQDSRFGIYDIGPATVRLYAKYIKQAQTLIWNGALGMFETHPFEYGTYAIADLFAARSKGKALGVAGGGETVEILRGRGIMEQVDLVSTGGGAMLEFLSGKKLSGLEALNKNSFIQISR